MWFCRYLLPLFLFASASAEPISVAVASNFSAPMAELVVRFEESTGHQVRVSAASTGMLYAQIVNGAPFSVLLAADAERPERLEKSGAGIPGTRFTYAIGGLVLWSADAALSDADCRDQLDNLESLRLAIANPQTAPYGVAAMQFLMRADLWNDAQDNLVFGENIAQTLQFVASKNANLGLIAASQAVDQRLPAATCQWAVPASMHDPIEQQAILIKDSEVGRALLKFLGSADAREIIRAHGYEVRD
ncbi:MAG: molybdate ABC transporter substrate-binding protein [Woeseiaceae bacterium]|nr:molybdate ABC transporter substrate-binding protein [Woeseiaceae bacterium]